MTRKLYYSVGSPYARTIRILLAELGLPFESDRVDRVRTVEEIATVNPCLAIPVLQDQGRTLFDTKVIATWLLDTYQPTGDTAPPFAGVLFRPEHRWSDMQVNAAIETLTETMVSLRLLGAEAEAASVDLDALPYMQRQRDRMDRILDWLDGHFTPEGRAPGHFTFQDITMLAVCEFSELRGVHPMSGRAALDATRAHFADRPSVAETVPV